MIEHVKAGKLRVLATWGDKRLASLPDVPTLTESGFDAVFSQWTALFAPAGTPEPVIAIARRRARRGRRSEIRRRDGDASKRRSSTSTHRSCSASGTPTRRSSREAVRRVGKVE